MAATQEPTDTVLDNMKEILKAYAKSSKFAEVCGFIGYNNGLIFKSVHNHNKEPQKYFSVSPLDYLSFRRGNEFVAVFHSHLNSDCEATEFDKISAENVCLPFVIYSLTEDKFSIYVPENSEISEEKLKLLKEVLK